MLDILNRDYKQSIESVRKEFKNCKYVMRMDNLLDNDGYLLAVSRDKSSYVDLGEFSAAAMSEGFILMGGCYEVEVSLSGLRPVD